METTMKEATATLLDEAPASTQPLVIANDPAVLMDLIGKVASRKDLDLARVQQLLDLKERWEKDNARKAYVGAMALFKADPPTIVKNKHVSYPNSKGGKTEYDHATHDEVVNKIIPALAKYGFSHGWNIDQQDKGLIKVTCTLTHVAGHSESVSMLSNADDSGGKNSIQGIVSAVTYMERHTLIAVTGLTTSDIGRADDDGRGSKPKPRVDDEQLANLEALVTEVGADLPKLLVYLKIEKLSDIFADNYLTVVKLLEAKRRAAK